MLLLAESCSVVALLLLCPPLVHPLTLAQTHIYTHRTGFSSLLFQGWPSTYKSYWKWLHYHTVPDTPYRLAAEVSLWQCLRTETKMKRVRKRKCVVGFFLVCNSSSRLYKADKKQGSIQYFSFYVSLSLCWIWASGQRAACLPLFISLLRPL